MVWRGLGAVGFGELRDAVFVRVGQRALRKLALETFTHIHRLSMRYHITRKTGGLSRIIERGVKGVDFLLRFMLFSVGPLILELTMVSILFAVLFGIWYMVVVVVTITLYVMFTFKVTEWRVRVRRAMNDQDNDANQKAIDSLLNFETVKYFGAEAREAARYDSAMGAYEGLAVKTGQSLSFLNFGQSFLITTGLVIVMVMAAHGRATGRVDRGRFRHGQRLYGADHHAAELSGHRLPRNPAGAGGYGADVSSAGPTCRDHRQARCEALGGQRWHGRV